jgi:hypothetical protein
VPLNLALITVDVMAGSTVFFRAAIEFVLDPANFTFRVIGKFICVNNVR